jgi:rhamnose transport system permease protein
VTSAVAASGSQRLASSRRAELALRVRVLGVSAFMLLLGAIFAIVTPRFLTVENLLVVAFNAAILAIVAVAVSIVLITRNLDLSVGSIMGLAGYLWADWTATLPELAPVLVLVPLTVGAVLGLVNGLLVSYGVLPSIIVTLGTLSIYRGITYIYAGGQQVTSNEIPKWMLDAVDWRISGMPALVVVAALVTGLVALALQQTPLGRQIYAVGSSAAASFFYGLRTQRIVVAAYVATGLLAGLAGLLYAARVGTVTVVLADGWELTALAAAVIGGVSVLGGSGSVVGAALGAVVLAMIDNGLVLLGVPEFWRMFLAGSAIIGAVTVDVVIERRIRRVFTTMHGERVR